MLLRRFTAVPRPPGIMATITNLFTERFGLQLPLMGAPMAGVSGPALAAAVANAGGMGFLGAAFHKDGEQLRSEFEEAVRLRDGSTHGLGIGLVGFAGAGSLQDTAINLKPHSIWVTFGEIDSFALRVKDAGIPLVVMVQSVQQALHAVADLGADAIVAQSNESGGHGAAASSTFCFTPEVARALSAHAAASGSPPVPLLAAGGVVTGQQVAAVLALGAHGAVLGTRLAATKESMYSQQKKERYVAAKGLDTHRTRLYDDLGPRAWPAGIDGRTLRNAFSEQPESLLQQAEVKKELQEKLAQAQKADDLQVAPVWAGSGVGLVDSIEPAEPLVRAIAAEAAATIQKLAQGVC